jgi:bifunctional non-homologous end joining protein LigD
MARRSLPAGFIIPSAPTLRERPPAGPDWTHEIKYDGWRMIARRAGEKVNLWSRAGRDYAENFGIIRSAMLALPVSATIDGEALHADIDFHALRGRAGQAEAVLVAFDLLEVDGADIRSEPIQERRARLEAIIQGSGIVLSEAIDGDGPTVFAHACRLGLEGIVSKKLGSRYRSGPS